MVDDTKQEDSTEKCSKETPTEQCSYLKLYSMADTMDIILITVGLVGASGGGVLLPLFTIIFGDFTDAFGDPDMGNFTAVVRGLALKFTYIAVAALVAMYLEVSCFVIAGERQTMRLRMAYLTSVLSQDVAFFDTAATTGSLLQSLNEDSLTVQVAISEKAANFVHHICTFAAGFIIAFTKGWDMTLVMLGCLPFMAVLGAALSNVSSKKNAANAAAYSKAATIAQQAIANVRTVAAYNGQRATMSAYESALEATSKMFLKVGLQVGLALGGIQFAMYCSYAVALFYGSYRIAAGKYTGGQVILVQLATLTASFAIGQAGPILQQFAIGRVAGYRMFQVIERKPQLVDVGASKDIQPGSPHLYPGNGSTTDKKLEPEHDLPQEIKAAGSNLQLALNAAPAGVLQHVRGDVELRDVHFAYPSRPDVPVFRGFSLVVPAGHTVALVGASGSGKSTAVQLIERFYDPSTGAVLLDGVDLRQLSLHWLRTQLGLVAQEPTLFATSIYENIAIGRPGCTKEDVEDAAKAANAHMFIRVLPEGYATQVGERGVQLSGGQKQRIAIARAILKNPKVLLLDEATSALDTHSERVVQAALDRMVVGRTTVVVAHRLSTIQHAHAIAVVANGQVVEQGTHAQLLAWPEGAYSLLVQMQMQAAAKQGQPAPAEVGVHEEAEEDDEETEEEEDGQQLSSMRDSALVLATTAAPATLGMSSAPTLAATALTATANAAATQLSLSVVGSGQVLYDDAERGSRLSPPGSGTVPDIVVAYGSDHAMARTSSGGGNKALAALQSQPKKELSKKEQEQLDEKAAKAVSFKRLLLLNKPEWPAIVAGCIGSACAGAQHPALAFVFADMLTIFYLPDMDELKRKASFYAWMFFVVGCGALASTAAQQLSFSFAGQRLALRIRTMLLGALLRQEVAFFDDDAHSSGKLTSALATDAAYIRGAVGDAAGVALQNMSTLVFGYLISLIYNWQMALLVTATFPVIIAAAGIQMKWHTGASTASDELYAGANQYISEAFSSIRIIHAFNLQSYITTKYRALLDTTRPVLMRQAHIGGLGMGFSFCSTFGMYGLIIWFGGWQIVHDQTDFNGMLKGFMAILLAAMGMAQAGVTFPDLGKAKGAVGRVFPLLDRQPLIDPDAAGETKADDHVKGEVAFNNIKFAYPSRPAVIIYQDFNLTIPAGKVYALVGESGSGKSTVVALLERFYDPLEGHIMLDGVDIKQLNLKWLRQQIGLVSQEPILFAGTVADNIRYGAPGASIEEVEAAARTANAHEFVANLPEGYNTVVGEGGGIQLSGGQKQRIAIARAVIKNPRVLLLDEATSALDARSERVVQDALDGVMSGRTCLVIAHRLSTIKNAHAINVLYRGKVLEQGTHSELMSCPESAYAKLVRAQETAHHA